MRRPSDFPAQGAYSGRRHFLRVLGLGLVAGIAVPGRLRGAFAQEEESEDAKILRAVFRRAHEENLADGGIGGVVAGIGGMFVGTPYAAHTLEAPGAEHLVVNLRAFDCVTFVESALAIARCIRRGAVSLEEFRRELTTIRYRSGVIDGYASRLHYFSEWVADNEKKGIVRDVAADIGGVRRLKTLDFMSRHRSAYRQLEDETTFDRITAIERKLSAQRQAYVPLGMVASVEGRIESGDVIALTVSTEGLDVSHTGIAVDSDGNLRYLHAPLSGGEVRYTSQPLDEYLRGRPAVTGIMVVRPMEPA